MDGKMNMLVVTPKNASDLINGLADIIDEDKDILSASQATSFLREVADYFIEKEKNNERNS